MPAEAPGLVEDHAVLVDVELDRRAVASRRVGLAPTTVGEPLEAATGGVDGERLDVDGHDRQLGAVADLAAAAGGSAASPGTASTTARCRRSRRARAGGRRSSRPSGCGRRWRATGPARRGRGTAAAGAPATSARAAARTAPAPARPRRTPSTPSFSHAQREVLLVVAVPRRPAHVVTVRRERTPATHRIQCAVMSERVLSSGRTIQLRYRDHVIDVEDAQRTVLEACPPLAPVETALDDVVGRVLAVDVTAGEDVPPFANSAVDGYAVRAGRPRRGAGRAHRGRRAGRRGGPVRRGARTGPGGADHDRRADPRRRRRGGDGRGQRRGSTVAGCASASPCAPASRARRRRRRARRRDRAAGRHRDHPGGCRRAGQRQRPPRRDVPAGLASPCCRPATSWSPTARRCARARSARATRRCSRRCSPRPAASSTADRSCPTTRRRWRPCCATPPPPTTPS